MKTIITEHYAGAPINGKQRCVLCAKVLQIAGGLSNPPAPVAWWPEGLLYEQGKNPTTWFITLSAGEETQVVKCNAKNDDR